jgi:hypothetical protein
LLFLLLVLFLSSVALSSAYDRVRRVAFASLTHTRLTGVARLLYQSNSLLSVLLLSDLNHPPPKKNSVLVRSSTSSTLPSTRRNATPLRRALRIGPGQSKQAARANRESYLAQSSQIQSFTEVIRTPRHRALGRRPLAARLLCAPYTRYRASH